MGRSEPMPFKIRDIANHSIAEKMLFNPFAIMRAFLDSLQARIEQALDKSIAEAVAIFTLMSLETNVSVASVRGIAFDLDFGSNSISDFRNLILDSYFSIVDFDFRFYIYDFRFIIIDF